jgi:hypothetical protein
MVDEQLWVGQDLEYKWFFRKTTYEQRERVVDLYKCVYRPPHFFASHFIILQEPFEEYKFSVSQEQRENNLK